MNTLDFYVKKYAVLRNRRCVPKCVMSPIRHIFRKMANKRIPLFLKNPIDHLSQNNCDVIVSFTTFPARIRNVWQVVECMKRQTIVPRKIFLWLSEDQFPNDQSIPESVRQREDDVFEIRLVKGDIRSHKKYYYVAKEFPDSRIVLIDDDIYYSTDFLESLLSAYNKNGGIVCKYGCIIGRNDSGNLLPYALWRDDYNYNENQDFFFGSGGGVIFTPSEMYEDIINVELAMELSPLADDVWLNAMARLSSLHLVKLSSGLILGVEQPRDNQTLATVNVSFGGNDKQIENVNNYYFKKLGVKVF